MRDPEDGEAVISSYFFDAESGEKVADQKNATLGETERVMKFALMDYEWGVSTGELTPTLKLKRRFITEKHADLIESLFE